MITVEVTWRGTRPVTTGQLTADAAWARAHGYPVHVWGDVGHDRRPVTLTRVTTPHGSTVALYGTS